MAQIPADQRCRVTCGACWLRPAHPAPATMCCCSPRMLRCWRAALSLSGACRCAELALFSLWLPICVTLPQVGPPCSSHHMLLLAGHAALLESGLEPG